MTFLHHRLIHFFIILALFLSAASPACKFISGQAHTLEICAADGSLKNIPLPEGYESPLPQQDKKEQHRAQEPCAFCFAAAHAKPVTPSAILLISARAPPDSSFDISFYDFRIARAELSGIEARPPPFPA